MRGALCNRCLTLFSLTALNEWDTRYIHVWRQGSQVCDERSIQGKPLQAYRLRIQRIVQKVARRPLNLRRKASQYGCIRSGFSAELLPTPIAESIWVVFIQLPDFTETDFCVWCHQIWNFRENRSWRGRFLISFRILMKFISSKLSFAEVRFISSGSRRAIQWINWGQGPGVLLSSFKVSRTLWISSLYFS